jgi:uncharacterized membrane protein YeaQ/YmgE (transglycosylase-associated protein family)
MFLLSWTHVRRVASWLAGKKLLEGNDYGRIMDMVMGIGGAVVGGIVMQSARLGGYWGMIGTTMVVMIGAVLLTLVAGLVTDRKTYARQL